MLENLYIKNVALIDKSHITFESGLNILTGETGAGKSMVLGSLQFALGGRINQNKDNFIRKGEASATVEATFTITDKQTLDKLKDKGIDTDDDGSVIISRTLNNTGKNICRMNGTMVTLSLLRELTSSFIDIYGQHEYQSLLNSKKHINLLDRFCGDEFQEIFKTYSDSYIKLKEINKKLSSLIGNENREQRIDILTFQLKEIDDSSLSNPNEEDDLLAKRKTLAYSEKLKRLLGNVSQEIYSGTNQESSACDKIITSISNLQEACNLDDALLPFCNELEEISARLDDTAHEIKKYYNSLDENPEELENIDDRLELISKLKRKYGNTISEILKFKEKISSELDLLTNSEEEINKLELAKEKEESNLILIGKKLRKIRKDTGEIVSKQIENSLRDMEMAHGRFLISVEEDVISPLGIDKVEFLFSANLGESLKPLSKIASGGEMSRVMLALKVVLVDGDEIGTFVFDEIDTGISGITAGKVGEKMYLIGEKRQIICITHLPQIACKANSHFLIKKDTVGENTITSVTSLSEDESVLELARLLGGSSITDTTLAAAKELKS